MAKKIPEYKKKLKKIEKMGLTVEVDELGWGVVIKISGKKGGPNWTQPLDNDAIERGDTGRLDEVLDGRVEISAGDVKAGMKPKKKAAAKKKGATKKKAAKKKAAKK